MTISSTTVKNSYSGDGSTTTFNYTFKIFADSDLQVIIRSSTGTETVKTITTHYTVTGAGSASGGSITFTAGNIPTATETVVLRRAVPQTQAIDYIANDPFPAESHEEGLDRAMMTLQQVQEEVTRSIKLSRTNTMTSTEFTVGASARANKILAFDTNGELSVTQELGTFVGNWSTATTFNARDLVKDTTNNNIYLCNTTHTSSGSLPISTNTDSAKWDLIVDAASATSSATAAASSATAAAASASAAATSESNAATSESNASTSETNAASSASSASTSATNASNSATSASTSASNASTSETNASNSATAAASSATTAGTEATNASNSATAASTSATNAASSASAASTSASNASTSETNASNSASAASTSATNASNSATAAATAQAAAEAALDNFDDVYLGAKSSDPTVDNDGDPLNAGDLYFNTSSSNLKYYDGSAWVAITSGGITDLVQDGTPQLGGQLDVNGFAIGDGTLELLKFSETASAVNELTITNSATGNAPELSSTGDDTNVDIKITPKGSGNVVLDGIKFPNADGTADQVLKTDGSGNLSFTDAFTGIAWQSSIVTGSTLTAVAGNGYWIDTTSNACTITLPSSANVGDQIIFVDYARTWETNAITINQNSLNFQGQTSPNPSYNTNGQSVTIVYSGATQGWIPTVDDDVSDEVPQPYSVDFLVIAGGGGGGGGSNSNNAGGGGAGGYRNSYSTESSGANSSSETSASFVIGTVYTITVGAGGTDGGGSISTNGNDSSISGSGFTTITSSGGGRGGEAGTPNTNGGNGGSGGGGGYDSGTGGSGTANQGLDGAAGFISAPSYAGGGGGGAGVAGTQASNPSTKPVGGNGLASSITGSSVTRAGGGGGGHQQDSTRSSGGSGGGGGGGASSPNITGTSGTANTGSGGGGSQSNSAGGNGGSGVVILRMPTANYSGTTTGSPTVTTSGSDTILVFNSSGSITG